MFYGIRESSAEHKTTRETGTDTNDTTYLRFRTDSTEKLSDNCILLTRNSRSKSADDSVRSVNKTVVQLSPAATGLMKCKGSADLIVQGQNHGGMSLQMESYTLERAPEALKGSDGAEAFVLTVERFQAMIERISRSGKLQVAEPSAIHPPIRSSGKDLS